MSKRITTRWYIGAWVVWLIAFIALIVMVRGAQGASSPPAGVILAYAVMAVAAIVTLVMWIGALVKLGIQQAWGWFAGVLILHLIGLGIIGMVAYAISGPEDTEVVTRPSTA
jgi:hypothetical protein